MAKHRSGPEPRRRYSLISLGCPKNLVDSERMAGLLRREGYAFTATPADADLVLINTCGFVADARAESYAAIEDMLALKREGAIRGVIVAGCLAQRERHALLEKYPEVDQVLGVFARDEIAAAAERAWQHSAEREFFCPAPAQALSDTDRFRITPRHLAYLKIAEGCSRACSFCTIPSIRGPYLSKPIEQIVAEAEQLAADGVKELVLVAQDTTYYGIDLHGRPRLAQLLEKLEAIEGLRWIRLMYLYPMHIDEPLLERLAAGGKTLPYVDLPLQHISDPILWRMRRGVTREATERLLDTLRTRVPELSIRTTFIVGFPGETEAQFAELLAFVRQQRFERLGVFTYCDERGTAAAALAGKLDDATACRRREQLMLAQQEIAFARAAEQVGQTLELIVDRALPEQRGVWLGRTRADAPEIDSAVFINGARLAPGQIASGEIVAAEGYDLVAYCEAAESRAPGAAAGRPTT